MHQLRILRCSVSCICNFSGRHTVHYRRWNMHRLRFLRCSVPCISYFPGLSPSKQITKSSSLVYSNDCSFLFVYLAKPNERGNALHFRVHRDSMPLLKVCELRELRQPQQLYSSDRAMSLLGNYYLCHALLLCILIIIIISVDEHYNVRILLDGS